MATERSVPADGGRIERARLDKGWSRADLAICVGCTPKTIGNAENGENIDRKWFARIAKCLGVADWTELVKRKIYVQDMSECATPVQTVTEQLSFGAPDGMTPEHLEGVIRKLFQERGIAGFVISITKDRNDS